MKKADILELAYEYSLFGNNDCVSLNISSEEIIGFAKAIAAMEREECARLCDSIQWSQEAKYFSLKIRSRALESSPAN